MNDHEVFFFSHPPITTFLFNYNRKLWLQMCMAVWRTILRPLGQSAEGFESFRATALRELCITQALGEEVL